MKKIFLFFIFLIFISCETTDIVMVNTIDEQSIKLIEEAEIFFLEYKFRLNKEYLKKSKEIIDELIKRAKNNRIFEAKVLGLKGEYEIIQGNKNIKSIIEEIERKNKNEEKLYILKAYLEDDIEKKESILKIGIEKANSNEKIKIFLADIYFLKGEYTKATSLYDDVFINISDDYKKFYTKRREIARIFIKNSPKNSLSALIIEKEKISFKDVIELTGFETEFLNEYKGVKGDDLKERLYINNFIFDKNINLEDFIQRKDVAYFLLKIVSIVDNNPSLLTKYVIKEKDIKTKPEQKNLSPVPDIKTGDYFYTAVLVLVEREIMNLIDGINFYPEEYISGLEYYNTLKKCK